MNFSDVKVGDTLYLDNPANGHLVRAVKSGNATVIKITKKYIWLGSGEYNCTRVSREAMRETESPYRKVFIDREHWHRVQRFKLEVIALRRQAFENDTVYDVSEEDISTLYKLRTKL